MWSPGTQMFMRRWLSWSRDRPTRAQPDWSACASGKSTAIATSCLTPPLEPSKANTHWPRFCCAAPLIEVTLQKGRATRYKHAARHVREIASLNAQVKDYAGFETHDQFMARLLRTHPRKTGFWPLLRD
jgi:hypothetical protein